MYDLGEKGPVSSGSIQQRPRKRSKSISQGNPVPRSAWIDLLSASVVAVITGIISSLAASSIYSGASSIFSGASSAVTRILSEPWIYATVISISLLPVLVALRLRRKVSRTAKLAEQVTSAYQGALTQSPFNPDFRRNLRA